MNLHLNYVAIIVATLSSLVVGTVWYSPKFFGTWWSREVGMTKEKQAQILTSSIIVTVIVSFFTALILAVASQASYLAFGAPFFLTAVLTSLVLWFGFTACRFITHDAFEGRSRKLTLLNVSHELVTLVVMALIIGIIHF